MPRISQPHLACSPDPRANRCSHFTLRDCASRILEEEKGAECENPTQILESHSSFTKQAENLESKSGFTKQIECEKSPPSSLRADLSAWQSTNSTTAPLESTFDNPTTKTHKVDSSNDYSATAELMDSKETSANAERYPLFSKEATLCHAVQAPLAMTEVDSSNDYSATAELMDSKETSANAERYPLFSKEATLCHAVQAPLAMTAKNAASENAVSMGDETISLVRQYGVEARVPIAIIGLNSMRHKAEGAITLQNFARACSDLSDVMRIAILVDAWKNDLDNPYMLVWRIVNNIDAKRDVLIQGEQVFIDARDKPESPAHPRAWPKETDCSRAVIEALRAKGFRIDDELLHRYHFIDARDKPESPAHPRAWPKETDCSRAVIEALRAKGFRIDDELLHRYHICGSPKTKDV